jgi:hypothetical protein
MPILLRLNVFRFYGIHWPDVDEDLSTEGLLRGAPAAKAA